MKKISAAIFDVDNTLYDFTDFYNPAMTALIEKVSVKSGVPQDQLKKEIRAIHQREGTSEYVFLLENLPCLLAKHEKEDIKDIYDDAIHTFRSERKKHLKLYDGVIETLKQMKAEGTRLIAYTESPGFHAMSRLKQLGLDGILDVVYSMPDHKIPEDKNMNVVRMYPESKYKFEKTEMRFTPRGVMKPNPESMQAILHDLNIKQDEILYVGDHLMKDVGMAKDMGLNAAHAEYGTYMDPAKYGLLKEITFWTDEMIKKEKDFYIANPIAPDVTLKSFSELLDHFAFVQYEGTPKQHKRFTPAPFSAKAARP